MRQLRSFSSTSKYGNTSGKTCDNQGKFKNINPTYLATSAAANQTPGGNKAIRMNQNYKIGPSKSLKVYAGDIVDLDVYAYYEAASGYGTSNASLANMIGAVALPFGGVSGGAGEAGMIYDGVQSALTIFGLGGNRGDTKPAAYLNYILFDENYGYIDAGWKPVAGLAPFVKGRLFFNPLNITTSGHLFVYLSYENQSNNYVHFDELRIRHEHSAVVHGQDYYAFGLPMEGRGIKREKYRYGFQGQYAEKDSLTGWNEFKLRMYDARIGRFTSVDPYGQFASPYLGMGNMPHMGTDPDGGWCCNTLPDAIADVGLNALADQFAIRATRLFSAAAIGSMVASGASAGGAFNGGGHRFSELNFSVPTGDLGGGGMGGGSDDGFGDTFSERASNPDLWLELGRSSLFGSNDPNLIQCAMPEAATWVTPAGGGIAMYSKLSQITKGGKGLIQAHHIVEVRHLKALKLSVSKTPAVILSKLKHQQITNSLRELLPYGSNYSKQQIMNAYRQAYKGFPEWIDEAGKFLGL